MRGKSIVARASPPFRAASGLQRIRRAIAATLAGLAVVTWQDPARADDLAPTEADRASISRCLEDIGQALDTGADAPGSRDDCIGVASAVCLDDPSGQSTLGQVGCLVRESSIWDEYLNRDYAALRDTLDEKSFAHLRDTQRKWIAYRDANCQMPHVFFQGGTIARPIGAHCVLELTARRANELAELLSWTAL